MLFVLVQTVACVENVAVAHVVACCCANCCILLPANYTNDDHADINNVLYVAGETSKFGFSEGRGPIPKKTSEEMLQYATEARVTKKPVNGFKDLSPMVVLYSTTIAYMIACDLAHNMKVCFKHVIKLFKGKRKMAPFKKPRHTKKIRERYKGNEANIPAKSKQELNERLNKWERMRTAQRKLEQVDT